jgi:hypothetical protein
MRYAGHVACMRGKRVLVGKLERKRPLGRPTHRRRDNIKIDLRETACGGIDWVNLPQDKYWLWAFVNMVMHLRVL